MTYMVYGVEGRERTQIINACMNNSSFVGFVH